MTEAMIKCADFILLIWLALGGLAKTVLKIWDTIKRMSKRRQDEDDFLYHRFT